MYPNQLNMSSEMFATMLSLWQGETSMLSPLEPFKSQIAEHIQKKFQICGLLKADGELSQEMAGLLQTLAQASMETNLLFSSAEQQKSYTLYATAEGVPSLSVFAETEETVMICTPPAEEEILNELKEYVPDRQGTQPLLKLEMAIADGLTLAAMLDLQRLVVVLSDSTKNSAAANLGQPQPAPAQGIWDERTILKVLQRDADAETAFWVFSSTLEMLVDKCEWTAQEVQTALKRLIAARLIEGLGEGKYVLIGPALHLANLLAAPEKMISLTRRWMVEEHGYSEIAEEAMIAICAPSTNLIFLRHSGDEIALCTQPWNEIITAITAVLFSPPSQTQSLRQTFFPISSKSADLQSEDKPIIDKTISFSSMREDLLSTWLLRTLSGVQSGAIFQLGSITKLGRTSDNDIVLQDEYTSSKHAMVERIGDLLTITDLGSTNGTIVNGTRINQPTIISDGDKIIVGNSEFSLEHGLAEIISTLQNKSAEKIEIGTSAEGVCLQCSSKVKPGKKFCWNCGAAVLTSNTATKTPAPVLQTCPNCGHVIKPGKKFCGNCGNIISN